MVLRKFYNILLVLAISVLSFLLTACQPKLLSMDQEAKALIQRVIPTHAQYFLVDTSLPQKDGKDTYSLSDTANGKILLRGNNAVSVASALNWYLKNKVNCHLSWCGDQLNLPKTLPKIGTPITISTPHKYRVYFNYCTLSYTAAWWGWERWQREIDFMAMQGINAPLSVIGLEGTWYYTLLKHGFTDLEARSFFVGPAHLAWQWMTNIESTGTPLPKSWIDSHIKLGQQIVNRQRALGMTPIQQGFSGALPRLMSKKHPSAKIKNTKSWCNFSPTAQLDPLDPLFDEIGKTFLEEQERLFGTSHLYGSDPFHEGHPPVKGDEYLKKVGTKIYELLNKHDPKSIWVMQSWSIRKPIATAVPQKDKLLILDLSGWSYKNTEGFWGYPFVSGRLHNFGNRINLHGDLAKLAKNDFAKINKIYPNSVGIGLFMEGIIQNPVYYELIFDSIWRTKSVKAEDWVHYYAHRRYGKSTETSKKAWSILLKTAYGSNTDGQERSSIICARPAIDVKKSGPNRGLGIPYNPRDLLEAWKLLLTDAKQLQNSDAYLYDIVDIGRQVLSNHGQDLQKRIQGAYAKKDLKAFNQATSAFHQLLRDVDTLLATRSEFSLGKWLSDARAQGNTPAEKDYYEQDARLLLTLWGPIDSPVIFDYSWREWSGLISSYYLPRWEKFHAYIAQRLENRKAYKEKGLKQHHGRAAFRANDFYTQLADWETAWVKGHTKYSPLPQGNPVTLSQKMLVKYADAILIDLDLINPKETALGKLIAKWSPYLFQQHTYRTKEVDITNSIDGGGLYNVTFLYKKGRSLLRVKSVELLVNGKSVRQDNHIGMTGNVHKNNTYSFKISKHAFGTKYALRYTAQTDGSNDSYGQIFLKKR